ncbi:hypothetical protein KP509_04G079900 [Ceratopteris richardii]|uniref:Uncharacterized protein n=2 Tax=Ceratopteris richardii TaxID=49495 RepID=A0A8T2UYT6_CERRI|nr:hypothetical protein KP509_04G079900 [Ceratopteris richardii]
MKMGIDPSSIQSGSKRVRPDDEVYLDNFHSHKRYLSEVMASSLNSLKVGDSLSGGLKGSSQASDPIDSPALTETCGISKSLSSYPSNGDELSTLDSYMSDESDNDSVCYRTGRVYYRNPQRALSSFCESGIASPVKSSKGVSSGTNAIISGFSMSSPPLPCIQSKQRVPDAEARFPSSPSDPCYSADLRRAALLRSLQMRAQSPVAISDGVIADENVDGFLDTCPHSLAEAEDQCSPCSPNLDELSSEQTLCNQELVGSPIHGTYHGQTGRGSGLVRSLLLDGCANGEIQPGFAVAVSDTDSTVLHIDKLESRDMNPVFDLSGLYMEEVSDSTEADNSNRMKWSSKR